jgi:hypothetical protein
MHSALCKNLIVLFLAPPWTRNNPVTASEVVLAKKMKGFSILKQSFPNYHQIIVQDGLRQQVDDNRS